jgi:hypothetical protein
MFAPGVRSGCYLRDADFLDWLICHASSRKLGLLGTSERSIALLPGCCGLRCRGKLPGSWRHRSSWVHCGKLRSSWMLVRSLRTAGHRKLLRECWELRIQEQRMKGKRGLSQSPVHIQAIFLFKPACFFQGYAIVRSYLDRRRKGHTPAMSPKPAHKTETCL